MALDPAGWHLEHWPPQRGETLVLKNPNATSLFVELKGVEIGTLDISGCPRVVTMVWPKLNVLVISKIHQRCIMGWLETAPASLKKLHVRGIAHELELGPELVAKISCKALPSS